MNDAQALLDATGNRRFSQIVLESRNSDGRFLIAIVDHGAYYKIVQTLTSSGEINICFSNSFRDFPGWDKAYETDEEALMDFAKWLVKHGAGFMPDPRATLISLSLSECMRRAGSSQQAEATATRAKEPLAGLTATQVRERMTAQKLAVVRLELILQGVEG